MSKYIDAHCHLTDARLFSRIDEVLKASRQKEIGGFILGGTHPTDWDLQLELQARYPGRIFTCFGIHPWFVAGRMGATGTTLQTQLAHALEILPEYLKKATSAGELGIDLGLKTDPSTRELQVRVFRQQLGIARKAALPLVLHIVKAHSEALAILNEMGPWPKGGLVHAFSGSAEIAQEYIQAGFTPSIGGVAARQGYETLKRALKRLDPKHIVVESDSPDQTPEGYQGFGNDLNDPRSLWNVAEAICAHRGDPSLTPAAVLQLSRSNLDRIFGLELSLESL